MYRIMIVDDETLIQNSIQKYITQTMPACQIIGIYGNGIDALNAFRHFPADIVLIDIRMPQMDGLELIRQLNQLSSCYIPIIISSYSEFSYAKTAMSLGVIYYLLKPIDFHEMTQAINAAIRKIDQHRYVDSPLRDQQEQREIFFTDLLLGHSLSKAAAVSQFQQLDLPFSYENSKGTLLHISLLKTNDWTYGKENLPIALCNILRMLLTPDYLLPLFFAENDGSILLIHPHSHNWHYEKFASQAKNLLNIQLIADPVFSFSSLDDLRKRDLSILPLASDITFTASSESLAEQSGIQKAIEYMNEHYMENLSREDVASKVFMSGAHFSRCFKKEMGITYLDYLTDLRMQKAIELLQTNCKIQDIGKQLGYPSQNRFIINFRHYTSYTPSEYRRKVLKLL